MSFSEVNDNTPSVNIENSTSYDITIFSPWRWLSALCSKQVSGVVHHGDASNARAGHLEVVTHIIHPATLPQVLFVTECQPGTYHTLPQQCPKKSCPTYGCSSNI